MCGSYDFDWLRKKVQTRLSWMIGMLILGTADVLANWLNWADLSSEELEHGLVVGPPPKVTWVLLLVFTVISTILYIPETLNTLSVLRYGGRTRFPIVHEQLLVLPLEHIPLCAINFFLSRCRGQYMTNFQTLCASIYIMYISMRLVWYAHIEGKVLHQDKEVQQKKGFFMLCCALYASAMAFPVMGWRNQMKALNIHEKVADVSIFISKAPFLEKRLVENYDFGKILEAQGWNKLTNPMLVKSVEVITKSSEKTGFTVPYVCNMNATFKPVECVRHGSLVFTFIHRRYLEAGPYGEVVYNYAFKPLVPTNTNDTCVPAQHDLINGWRMFYFQTVINSHGNLKVNSPWKKEIVCSTPRPWYDSSIQVC